MNRIKIIVQYDGTNYNGWQRQQTGHSIQEEIEKGLEKLTGEPIVIYGASRTDAGVHANAQTAHFDESSDFPIDRIVPALNSILPEDISILSAEKVDPKFHARFDAQKKWYRYHIFNGKRKEIFNRKTSYHFEFPLDENKMQEAAHHIIGKHDFSSFKTSTPENERKEAIRTLYRVDVDRKGEALTVDLVGDGFLYKMVRGIVGSLIEVGRGKISPIELMEIVESKDRQKAGPNLPGHGLFLMQVTYSNQDKKLSKSIKLDNSLNYKSTASI